MRISRRRFQRPKLPSRRFERFINCLHLCVIADIIEIEIQAGYLLRFFYRYIKEKKMDDFEQNTQPNIVDTTDCLEAVSVFRGVKNGMFLLIIFSMIIVQLCFWLVDTGYVGKKQSAEPKAEAALAPDVETEQAAEFLETPAAETEELASEANEVVIGPEIEQSKTIKEPQAAEIDLHFQFSFKHVQVVLRIGNFLFILTSILYCLTTLFALKISLLGRLGGINHIARAFFWSLFFLVILLPWQYFFEGAISGVMFGPEKLAELINGNESSNIFMASWHYFRFTVSWVIALILLIFAQLRSMKWSRTILRRLEII